MSSIPLYHCQISTDNTDLISKLLEKEKYLQEDLSYIKSYVDYNIKIDLSQSFDNPSIICCCSLIPITLPQLLSSINPKTIINRYVIFLIQSTENFDWNSIINLITDYNLSLNIVNNEYDFIQKLDDIIQNLAKQNITKQIILKNNNRKYDTPADMKV